MKIGCMIWRIGARLDFFEQLDWVRENGFQEVSFWSWPGHSDQWRGFDLVASAPADLARLKAALRDFEDVDIHAPSAHWSDLDTGLASPDPAVQRRSLDALCRLIERSAECGAKVITLHAGQEPGKQPHSEWHTRFADSLAKADGPATEWGVRIGVELTSDYDLVLNPSLLSVGMTVDTGHMQFNGGAGYREYGSLAALIRDMGPKVFHVHAHDYNGKSDHIAIGTGHIDFPQIIQALMHIGYAGSLCLELTDPNDFLASRRALERMIADQ